ncbi:MAG: PQQ-binding-like beta-propeller repeat protein [Gammaproteobacteria bacterium]
MPHAIRRDPTRVLIWYCLSVTLAACTVLFCVRANPDLTDSTRVLATPGGESPGPHSGAPAGPAPMIAWRYAESAAAGASGPAVDPQGGLYLSSGGALLALRRDGSLRWKRAADNGEDRSLGVPVLDPAGRLLVGMRGRLLAFDTAGRQLWVHRGQKASAAFSHINIAPSGLTYAVENLRWLHAFSRSGDGLWSRELTILLSDLRVGPANRVYVVTGGKVVAYNEMGESLWAYRSRAGAFSRIGIGPDGSLYATGLPGTLAALGANGYLHWEVAYPGTPPCANSGITFGPDGTLYIACRGEVSAYTRDGTRKWHYRLAPPAGEVPQAPVLGPDGTLYLGADGLRALSAEGHLSWHVLPPRIGSHPVTAPRATQVTTSPVIGSDGTIFVGYNDGCVQAVGRDGNLLWVYSDTHSGGGDRERARAIRSLHLGGGLVIASGADLVALPLDPPALAFDPAATATP